MDTRLFILNELKRIAQEVSPKSLRKSEFLRRSNISERKLRTHFDSWNSALIEAGLDPSIDNIPARERLSDEQLLSEIGEVWKATGKRPTEDLMNRVGKYSVRPYYARWGSFSKALTYFVNHFGYPDSGGFTAASEVSERSSSIHPVSEIKPRKVPTHKPAVERDRRVFVGEPVNFRGLQYAPVNEQGVVYLFGMVSRELGFLVEIVRTAYPDCEGKRRLDSSGERWEHLRIEFEYRSKNFLSHGHDPNACELIVCWIHDWPESPVEVLELREAIKYLPG